ncbi:hypothetical protein B0H66DRAFT_522430 [Apodospora peruviana]|uniref:TM7S3/TM198-like domain-containing protein n=1 Tax=Apodospora peruviana TaxID=516989 RepID=A0AAE0LZK2_9PEZI|nr:hypothetical protein B0H66DRAFT_522430 [Apodospora peruviana]
MPADQLPLDPAITPGLAVAGVILVITGAVYTLVGIKTRWLHSFFSTAFLGSLGTSVLIVYVMNPPVSNAIQGAYVVAVTCTGLILGGLALVFKETTECLACLLGGFCFSMWLLTLQPGGIIQQTGGRIGFIAAFTLAGFGLYFTPWTRNYGMIACISFSGATVAVLGIDCFSRAGYKEFWAYLWALNDDLFPLGTETYPLTKGMRVEIAITILIFLAGIVSQLKLWRVIKDRQRRRDEERAEGERAVQTEEENIGRRVERMNARERRQWERVYGDENETTGRGSADSGVDDLNSEKRMRDSRKDSAVIVMTRRTSSQSPAETDPGGIDWATTTVPFKSTSEDMVVGPRNMAGNPTITVMAAQDDIPTIERITEVEPSPEQEKGPLGVVGSEMEANLSSPLKSAMKRESQFPDLSPSITPLPFKVPNEEEGAEEDLERSSAATFADEEDEQSEHRLRTREGGLGDSLVRKLSNGSAKLFRSLSQRSKRGKTEPRNTPMAEESQEGLVELSPVERDDLDSVAANLDALSSVTDALSVASWEAPRDLEADADLVAKHKSWEHQTRMEITEATLKSESQADGLLDSTTHTPASLREGLTPSPEADADVKGTGVVDDAIKTTSVQGNREQGASSRRHSEERSLRRMSTDSAAASLTRDNLPTGLSRVALSYRTNEWAKHLSAAEAPEPDMLQVEDGGEKTGADVASEEPVPLDVIELQKTPENAVPPPAAPRSSSAMSNYSRPPSALARNSSSQSLPGHVDGSGFLSIPTSSSTPDLQKYRAAPYRSVSVPLKGRTTGLFAQPIAEEGDGDSVRNNVISTTAIPEESPVATPTSSRGTTPSPVPVVPRELSTSMSMYPNIQPTASTLMGMRETLLRTKASAGLLSPPINAVYGHNNSTIAEGSGSESGSIHNYPMYSSGSPGAASPSPPIVDADDIPLSQRRLMIRQSSSSGNFNHKQLQGGRNRSNSALASMSNLLSPAEAVAFNSHQPIARRSTSAIPPEAVRQAQLANFRSSVQNDLMRAQSPYGATAGRDSPMLASALSLGGLRGAYANNGIAAASQLDVHRSIETQRNYLMGQKEAEMMRKETERMEAERREKEFEERMRSGALMGAHRDAMRRMQARARDG